MFGKAQTGHARRLYECKPLILAQIMTRGHQKEVSVLCSML